MIRSKPECSSLDRGNCKFDSFLNERLAELHADLVLECDRIAVTRELSLKHRLEQIMQENQELRKENAALSSRLGIVHMPIGSDQVDASNQGEAEQDLAELSSKQAVANQPLEVSVQPEAAKATVEEPQHDLGSPNSNIPKDTASPNIFSLDGLPNNIEPLLEICADQAHHVHHFALWDEWQGVMDSASAEGLECHLQKHDSALEIDWLHGHEANEQSQQLVRSQRGGFFNICTISPNSSFSMCWDMLGIPVLFYDLVTIPLGVFYTAEGTANAILGWAIIIYWTSDVLLRLLVFGYLTPDGEVECGRKQIIKRYIRTSFCFDFCMVAPDWLSMLIGAPRNLALLRTFRIMRLSRVMRMSKLKALIRKVQDYIDSEYFSIVTNIAGNLISIIGWCHYLGCFWFWLGSQDITGYTSWVQAAQLEDAQWEYQYLLALHWAITQFTPASSKIGPHNIPEATYAITVLVFGMTFFSLFISRLTQDRIQLKALTGKIEGDTWTLRKYLRQHGISQDLTVRAIHYVDMSVVPLLNQVQRKDVHLLDYLSRPLQLEVQAELYYNTLLIHPFLRRLRQRSGPLTSQLFTHAVHTISLASNDLLFTVGQVCHEMYFVKQGILAYLMHGSNTVSNISSGHWICEMVIWVPWVQKGTVKAANECHIVSIDSANLRTGVLEHKERTFVRRCAHAYLNDLNEFVDAGGSLTDITDITDNDSSKYMQAIASDDYEPGN